MKVAICMATYNGAGFIKKQISSILNQTYCDFDLYIRDDCSTDSTLNILREMEDSRIKLIYGPNKNIGYKENFKCLMNVVSEYDLVFFSDQDDLWEKDKIESYVNYIVNNNVDCVNDCILLYSNYMLIDSEDSYISIAYDSNYKIADMHSIFVQNDILGCTMAISKALLQKTLNIPEASYSHDDWVALVATIDGKLVYFEKPYISHRIHANNATRQIDTTKVTKRLIRVVNRFRTNKDFILRKKELYNALNKTVHNKNCLHEIHDILYQPPIKAYRLAKKWGFRGVNQIQTNLFLMQILLK